MEAKKSHDLLSASWGAKEVGDIIQSKVEPGGAGVTDVSPQVQRSQS